MKSVTNQELYKLLDDCLKRAQSRLMRERSRRRKVVAKYKVVKYVPSEEQNEYELVIERILLTLLRRDEKRKILTQLSKLRVSDVLSYLSHSNIIIVARGMCKSGREVLCVGCDYQDICGGWLKKVEEYLKEEEQDINSKERIQ